MKPSNSTTSCVVLAGLLAVVLAPTESLAVVTFTKVTEQATAPYASGVAVAPDDSRIFVAIWEGDSESRVLQYGLPGLSLIQAFAFGAEHSHGDVVLSADGTRFFTPNFQWSTVSQINMAAANSRVDQPSVQSWPGEIDIMPDHTRVVVSAGQDGQASDLNNDGVALYGIGSGAFNLLGFVPLPDEISSKKLGFSDDSQFVYVPTRTRKSPLPRVYEIGLAGTPSVTRYMEINTTGQSPLLGVACSGNTVYVSDYDGNQVWTIDRTSWTATNHPVPGAPATMAMHPDGRHLFVVLRDAQTILAIDTQTMTTVGQYDALEDNAHDIEFGSAGTKLYVQHRNASGTLMVFDLSQAPTGDLVAHYRFDGDATDASGNGNDGTPINVLLAPDRFGNGDSAYYFNGANARINVPTEVMAGGLAEGTLACWVRADSYGLPARVIFNRGIAALATALQFNVQPDGRLLAYLSEQTAPVSIGQVPLGLWTYVTLTWDAATLRYYVDADPAGTFGFTPGVADCCPGMIRADIGVDDQDSSWFHGAIDDFRIYNRALTQEEISTLYQEVTGTNGSPTVDCPGTFMAECGVPVMVWANVADPDGDALVAVWAVNGVRVQTNLIPAAVPSIDPVPPPPCSPFPPVPPLELPLIPPVPPTDLTPPELDPTTPFAPDPLVQLSVATAVSPGSPSTSATQVLLPLAPEDLVAGTNLVAVTVSDSVNPPVECTTTVIVQDTQPPIIANPTATPGVLWPPNHEMVHVSLNALATDSCGPATWRVHSVSCSEPDHDASDIRLLDQEVVLRATRSGKSQEGRLYTIYIQAMDAAGNASQLVPVTVTVPHDQGRK